MAQISYGTITITDTNDIESITIEYARNQSTSSPPDATTGGWSTTRPAWAQGYYIWQRARIHKSGTETSADTFGAAVCLTGSAGQTGAAGRSLTSTTTEYTIAAENVIINENNMGNYTWSSDVPAYSSSKPVYWVRVTNIYSNPSSTEYIIYKDNGITDAVATSVEANGIASEALALAQNTNYAWWSLAESKTVGQNTFAAGSYGTFVNSTTFQNNPTNQPNIFMDSNGIHLRRALVDLASFTGTSLTFYQPPTVSGNTTTQGKKTMMLSSNALRFYNPSDGTTEQAVLDANGLVLSKGGIVAGTKGQTGYIYLSTVNHPVGTNGVTVNGFTPTSSTEQWREVIGTKFGVTNAGTLYANNAIISGTITVGSGSTIDSGATIGGTSASTVVSNAATGAQASSDLSNFQTTVTNTYATKNALSDVEGQIPSDINELSDTDGIIPNDLSQLTDITNIISSAVNTGVAGKADKTEAVYRTQRIYRRYIAAQSSLNGPTTWVTNNTDIYNDWTTKIPPLTNNGTKYSYLYTCTQKQTVTQYNGGSGTECISTTVLLDDTTTIIDGGSIIAGSVTANEITGSKLSAIYADMGNITAGNITKGYNSINFDNSPATLEFKNDSTWVSATKGIQWTGSDLNIKGNITATSLTISSGATVSGVVVPSQIANMATQTDVADASYSVEIQVSSIDYTTYAATLVAVPYCKGVKLTNSTTPSLNSITYQWYKNGVELSNTDSGVTPSISGATTSTLELGVGTDFGTDGTNPTYALYTCVISN